MLSINTLFSIIFFHLDLWSVDFFLIASLPDHCLLVPFLKTFTHVLLRPPSQTNVRKEKK